LLRKLKLSIVLFFLSFTVLQGANKYFGDDTYSIDNSKVLLYKLINWWNVYGGDESQRLCNRSINYEDTRKIKLKYFTKLKTLEVKLDNDFASLISILGSNDLKSTYLDITYFDTNIPQILNKHEFSEKTITFKNINPQQYHNLKKIQNDLVVVVEGKISGLLEVSGKIALHNSGSFFRKCFSNNLNQKIDYPLTLKILDNKAKKLLVQYELP